MPRYRVETTWLFNMTVIIDAEDEAEAGELNGEIVSEDDSDSWQVSVDNVEQIGDDEDGSEQQV